MYSPCKGDFRGSNPCSGLAPARSAVHTDEVKSAMRSVAFMSTTDVVAEDTEEPSEHTVELRSVEQTQLEEMLPIAIEAYNDMEMGVDTERLVDIHLEVTNTDGELTLLEDDWRLVVSSLGHPEVISEEGETRVDYLRSKLYWRGVEDEDKIMGSAPV